MNKSNSIGSERDSSFSQQEILAYKFDNPGRARLRVATLDEKPTCDTSGSVWIWHALGSKHRINWSRIASTPKLKEILKAYFFHRLETRTPNTVIRGVTFIKFLAASPHSTKFPWDEIGVLAIFASMGAKDPVLAIHFRVFYLWCLNTGKPGFSRASYFSLEESIVDRPSPYQDIFLHQNYLLPADEITILKRLQSSSDSGDRVCVQRNVLLHLCFELAPRPSQIYALNVNDFIEVWPPTLSSASNSPSRYFSLWLPMTKKRALGPLERRPRRISPELALKIKELISLEPAAFSGGLSPLFKGSQGHRLSAAAIIRHIRDEMRAIGISPGATKLRHHLGQGLADQGAPADVIAEALGHNTTVAARAYIAATPAIATVKTRALGKNKTYQSLMQAMLTGTLAIRNATPKEQWVKGVVHMHYIHGIGGCDLSPKITCPKNPVYSCYLCPDFHPFLDGPHHEVKVALQAQAQLFLDVATESNDINHTRTPLQLELTLEAVDAVIERCDREVFKS